MLLTNGAEWQAHRVRFEQPIRADQVFAINLLEPAAKTAAVLEHLYLISREGAAATAIDNFWEQKEATSRYVVAQLLLSQPALSSLRRHLRRMYPGVRVSEEDLSKLLAAEVIKRDALEGPRADEAAKTVKRYARKRARADSALDVSASPAPPLPA